MFTSAILNLVTLTVLKKPFGVKGKDSHPEEITGKLKLYALQGLCFYVRYGNMKQS
jgi:hypothetical protein